MDSQIRKNLIFIERKEQVILFSKHFKKANFHQDYEVIALNPSVHEPLKKLDIKFTKSDFYFKNDDHSLVIDKAEKIISEMRDMFLLEDEASIKYAYERDFFYFFRNYYLNYCLSLVIIIHNCAKLRRPKKIFLPTSVHPINLKLDNGSIGMNSLIGYLGELFLVRNEFEIVLEGNHNKYNSISEQQTLGFLHSLFYQFIFASQLIFYKFFTKDKNIIFTANSAYNITKVMESLMQKVKNSFNVGGSKLIGKNLLMSVLLGKVGHFFFFPPPAPKKKLNVFLNNYDEIVHIISKKINCNPEVFSIYGISFQDLIVSYLKNGLRNSIQKTFNGSLAFNRILEVKKPALVLSNQASGYHYAIGEHCRLNKINAILISHGTHIPHKEKWPKKEWDDHALSMINTHFPYVAVQTPWAHKFLEQQRNVISKPIITGPLLYSSPKSKNHSLKKEELFFENHNKTIILHAATPFGWDNLSPYVNLTQDEYIKHINDLIRSVDRMDNVFLAIRIRLKTFKDMTLDDIKKLFIKSNCFQIYTDGSFDDYLLCSDLLVSFSSTTIEEALQLKIPVLQYDPFNRYVHIPSCNLVETSKPNISPIYYASELESLKTSLDWIKKNHLDIPNSKFLVDWSAHKIQQSDNWMLPILGNQLIK